MKKNSIIILDFGSQYNQLIARRIREMNIYAEVVPYFEPLEKIIERKPKGIILSGGPASVYLNDSPTIDKKFFEIGIPILGICYGMQLTQHLLGGKVTGSKKQEFGKSNLNIKNRESQIVDDVKQDSQVWMSHADHVIDVAPGFNVVATTDSSIAILEDSKKKIYNLQFHPEVTHSVYGTQILKNFIYNICGCKENWRMDNYADDAIKMIKDKVGNKKVILGLSGGVDSSVAAVLIHKAIGDNLTCIFVDTGLLRKHEDEKVKETYEKHFNINIKYIKAEEQFLEKIKSISDPEKKRKIIGLEFIKVFDSESKKIDNAEFLAQGTIYPDVIESQSIKGPSMTIKSHHNVGGLPKKMKLKLLEPLRELFKDEVRKLGFEIGIPKDMVMRHPFPGPGLGIRVIGEVTKEKCDILRNADDIFISELYNHNLYNSVAQAFVALLPVKSVGVMGDVRTYEYTAILRSVNSIDFMTATWSRLPYDFLEKVSSRIINEVKGINRIAYDISSKPPATIEWE